MLSSLIHEHRHPSVYMCPLQCLSSVFYIIWYTVLNLFLAIVNWIFFLNSFLKIQYLLSTKILPIFNTLTLYCTKYWIHLLILAFFSVVFEIFYMCVWFSHLQTETIWLTAFNLCTFYFFSLSNCSGYRIEMARVRILSCSRS